MSELRACGDNVLLVRVHNRGRLIAHVHETMGVTDGVFQLGEIVGIGNRVTSDLKVGQLCYYPSPRVADHFRHSFPGKGTLHVAVVPGYWVSAIVESHLLAEDPSLREYGGIYE